MLALTFRTHKIHLKKNTSREQNSGILKKAVYDHDPMTPEK